MFGGWHHNHRINDRRELLARRRANGSPSAPETEDFPRHPGFQKQGAEGHDQGQTSSWRVKALRLSRLSKTTDEPVVIARVVMSAIKRSTDLANIAEMTFATLVRHWRLDRRLRLTLLVEELFRQAE